MNIFKKIFFTTAFLGLVVNSSLQAQCPNVNLPATGGGFHYVIVNGDTISQHTTERAAAARAITEKMRDTSAVVTYDINRSTRVEGCFLSDTVVVPTLPDTIRIPLDTITVEYEGTIFNLIWTGQGNRYNVIFPDTIPPPPSTDVIPPSVNFISTCDTLGYCEFDGRNSNDNIGITLYRWTFGGFSVDREGPSLDRITVGPGNGTFVITLTVFDAAGNSSLATRTITVSITSPPPPPTVTVSVDTALKYQVMTGWEATAQIGQTDFPITTINAWKDTTLKLIANLGINRVRLEIYSGAERPEDAYGLYRQGSISDTEWRNRRYTPINDNASPTNTNTAGFHFTKLDESIETIVLPLRQLLAARGESLYVNLNYVSFGSTASVHNNSTEYAEFMLAAFKHMQNKYGFTPNAIEVILEPDNGVAYWRGNTIAAAIVATGDLLRANGFTPDFIAPSVTSAANAVSWTNTMLATPRIKEYLTDISYHRYVGATPAVIQSIGDLSIQQNIRTGMGEHIGSGVDNLYSDIVFGNNSWWQQFAIAYPTSDNGAQYLTIQNGSPVIGSRTYGLSQYFKYVRLNARRVGAVSTNTNIKPIAFVNANGTYTVVLHVTGTQSLTIGNLRPGTYEVTRSSTTGDLPDLPNVIVGTNGIASISVPGTSIVTVSGVSAPSPPPPTDTIPTPPVDTLLPPPVIPPPPPPATNRQFVSAERIATWRGMRDANHYLWQTAASVCPLTDTAQERYGDIGMWCAIVAATNDDAGAAARAIGKLRATSSGASANTIREEFIARVLMLDLVAPWLTASDRAVIAPLLDQWPRHVPTARAIDSDAFVGEGCGALLWDRFNGRAPGYPNVPTQLARYIAASAGGVWIESSQYNAGTLTLLAMCNEAHRAATGQDVVPGASVRLREAGYAEALAITPDLRGVLQWGDDQYPRQMAERLYRRLSFLGGSAHPVVHGTVAALLQRNPTIQFNQLMAYGLFLWRTDVAPQVMPSQVTHVATGMGQVFRRDGNVLAWASAHNLVGADHSDFAAAFDVQVYRDGWLLTHPIAYYSPTWGELIPNGAVYAGLGYFADRRMTWADSGNGWAAIAGEVRGQYGIITGWPAPRPFLDVGHRVTVLATVNGEPVVIVRDSVVMSDPRAAGYGFPANYRENGTYPHQSRMTEFDFAPWAIWHTPAQATVSGNRASWTAPTGDPVSLWFDGATVVTTVDEAALYGSEVTPVEKKWQLRLKHGGVLWQVWSTGTPTVSRSGDTITVGGKAFTITSAGVQGS